MFVTGCHRSGTSYVAMILDYLVDGKRAKDLDATVDNPRGYFESTILRGFNDRLLHIAGYSWDRPPLGQFKWDQGRYLMEAIRIKEEFRNYSLSRNWIDKDPRLSLTMPIYDHILLERRPTVAVIRPPAEVQRSLFLRDGFSCEKGLMIWLLYNRGCASFLRGDKDVLIDFPELLSGDEIGITRLGDFIARCEYDIVGDSGDLVDKLKKSHKIHSEKRLRRSSQPLERNRDNSGGKLYDYCQSVYEKVKSSGNSINVFKDTCRDLPGFVIDMYHSVLSEGEPSLEYLRCAQQTGISQACSTGNAELDEQLITSYSDLILAIQEMKEELRDHDLESVERLRRRIKDMEDSSSWKATAALRWVASLLRK